MITNLDHLHRVVEGKVGGRQCGKTFASCHYLAGLIGLELPHIFAQVRCWNDLRWLVNMIQIVLSDHDLPPLRKKHFNTWECHKSIVQFISTEQRERGEVLHGVQDSYLADLSYISYLPWETYAMNRDMPPQSPGWENINWELIDKALGND